MLSIDDTIKSGVFFYVFTESNGVVILSDRRESKDLRTAGIAVVKSVRRSFDSGLRPALRMTYIENFAETDCLFCGKMVFLSEIDREIGTKEEPT